jgi:hypothetical protein
VGKTMVFPWSVLEPERIFADPVPNLVPDPNPEMDPDHI